MSNDLLKNIGHNMTNFEDLDKVFFFGEEFSQIIDEKIQGLSAENQSD